MNKKGLFAVLDNGDGTGSGVDIANPDTTLGSAIDKTIASPAFIDAAGVLVFPQLDSEGRLPVTTDEAGACHHAYALVTGSTSYQDLGSFAAALLKKYNKIGFAISSCTEADYELVYIDDVGVGDTETILGHFSTGPGQYSFCCEMSCVEVDTTAGTGIQAITLRAKLLEATGSEIAGTLWLHEITE